MLGLMSALVIAAAVVWGTLRVTQAIGASRSIDQRAGTLELMTLFAPGIAAAADDPRALLAWQPLAATARKIFPAEFSALDQASGGRFPFSVATIEAAHARWSADWLAWEGSHDTRYKLKAAEAERELATDAKALRTRLDAIDREKVELYQQRYSDYVRVSRSLQAFLSAL